MPRPEKTSSGPRKPPPLKIGEWPRWLKPEAIVWIILALSYLIRLWFLFLWGRYKLMLFLTATYLVLVLIFIAFRFVASRRDSEVVYTRPKDPPEFCPVCRYDLRATPLRCPECGTETAFKKWLDDHPLDKVIYEKRLKPKLPNHDDPQPPV